MNRQLKQRLSNSGWRSRVVEAGKLFGDAYHGDLRSQARLKEAMSTSDFPILLGDFLNRTLAAKYAVLAPIWPQFAAKTTVKDFRRQKIVDLMGGAGLLPRVRELAPFEATSLSESEVEFAVEKFGERLPWSWEMQVNDDLGAFASAPDALSIGARATEDHAVVEAFVSSAGPVGGYTQTGAALSQTTLQAGIDAMCNVTDSDGNRVVTGNPTLVVPESLSLTAQNILNVIEIKTTSGSKESRVAGNGLSRTPKLVVNPHLSAVDQTADKDSTWYLLFGPETVRPSVFAAFLRGYEEPDLRYKADAGVRPGGGAIDPLEGSFDNDGIDYRIRHVVGGARGLGSIYSAKA